MATENVRMRFAQELVAPVIDGDKTATVRYDGFEDLHVGDRITAITESGFEFTTIKVTRVATVQAVEAHDIINVLGAEYPSESPQDVIDALNKHYDGDIRPETKVRVIVFEVGQ